MQLRSILGRSNLNDNKGYKKRKEIKKIKKNIWLGKICKLNFIFVFINFIILIIAIYFKK